MNNLVEIQNTLHAIIQLLKVGGEKNWERALAALAIQMETDADTTFSQLLTLFGGMGSFNDVVLHVNGVPLIEENNELARLRSKLFDLCH